MARTPAIGRAIPRRDGRAKVTGQARYIDDLTLPGMLHGVTVRSPVARGIIHDIIYEAGVPWDEITVVTAADIPGRNVVALILEDQPYLADSHVNHVEEPILLLAHTDKHLIEEARRLVRFEILADGRAGPRRVVAELPGTVPDGIAFAADGSAVIACYRPDIVFRWRPDGPPELLAADIEGTGLAAPTNVLFHGPDLDTISVPNIGRWHVTTFRVEGLRGTPLWYPVAADLGY